MTRRRLAAAGALVLLTLVALQFANDHFVRQALCEELACSTGAPLALDATWPPGARTGPLPTLQLRGTSALLRRGCDHGWTLGPGARLELDPFTVDGVVDAGGGCADIGATRLRVSLQPVRVRHGACELRVSPLTAHWHDALVVNAEAGVQPQAAEACHAALGAALTAIPAGRLAEGRLALEGRYALPYREPLPKGLRALLGTVATSQKLTLTAGSDRLQVSLTSAPGPGTASPELALAVAVEGGLRERLPRELQSAAGAPLELRWNLDHDTGVVHLQGLPQQRFAAPPRPAGAVDPAAECRAPGRTAPLHFVEVDEQGAAAAPAQLKAVFDAVDGAQARAGVLVSVFVHGWQHSASPPDSYVCDFSVLLRSVDEMERHAARAAGRPARQVLGVYVGWPGRLYPTELANLTTFWNRLQVADRLGRADGALRSLLLGLTQRIGAGARDARPDRRSGIVVTGHSMGGRAVFHAIRDAFDRPDAAAAARPPAPDLVLLVNPAFSAEQYRAVHERTRQCQPLPVPMLLFSSESDAVTRQVYPVGQAVTFDEAQQRGVPFIEHVYTAANFEAFVTHRLGFELLAGDPPDRAGAQSILRGFERVPAGSDELLRDDPVTVYRQPTHGRPAAGDAWYRMSVTPRHAGARACADERSRVVAVDRRILPDHGTIFTPPFMEVVIRLFNRAATGPLRPSGSDSGR